MRRWSVEFAELKDALTFRHFEPESWRDYALVPWWVLRWAFAYFYTIPRTSLLKVNLWIRSHCWPLFLVTRHVLPLHSGRWEDTDPTICERCLWAGMRRWCIHDYRGGWDDGNVEAEDECPRCRNSL